MWAKTALKKIIGENLEIHLQAADHYFNGEQEIRLMKRMCDRNRPAVDIGANIGTYAYYLRRYASSIIAYEPNPDLAARLRRILTDVDIRQKALSDSAGTLALKMPVVDGRSMHELASIAQDFDYVENVVSHNVEVGTIDAEDWRDVGFLKIDVEQNEIPVLRGGLETVKRCRPVIMTEATPLLYGSGLLETFSFITELNYVGWFTFEGRKLPFSKFDADLHANEALFGKKFMSTNIFFLPSEVNAAEKFGEPC